MAVDIGTGTIAIEIDQRQVRAEAMQASRTLERTPTELRPQIDARRLGQRIQQGISAVSSAVWAPMQAAGIGAMQAVGASGVAALTAVEARGLAAAARMRAAFSTVRVPSGAAGPAAAAGGRAGAARGGVVAGAARGGLGIFAVQGLSGSLSALDGNIGELAAGVGSVIPSLTSMGPAFAAVAAGLVGLNIGIRRFQQFGGFGEGAPGGAFLEALGFRRAGRISAQGNIARQVNTVRVLTGATGDLARARLRAARETDKTATQEQRSRGEFERARRQEVEARRRDVRNLQERLGRARARGAQGGIGGWWARNFREPDLEAGIDINRDQQRAAQRRLNEARFGSGFSGQLRRLFRAELLEPETEAPRASSLRKQSERLRILNEQQIDAVADQADAYRRGTDLLRRQYNRDSALSAEHNSQRRRYIRAIRQRTIAERAAAIRENAIANSFRTGAGLIFGRSGLSVPQRFGAAMEFLTTKFQAIAGPLTAVAAGAAALAAVTYLIVRASRRYEQQLSAQIAAASIAQRTVGGPGGAPVDIRQVQAGIRAGAADGLSELEVSRAAVEAIRTGSEDIFLNTERVLTDLRVVAAATGVAFEDATRRFFRGIIKREQELLDELGIIARVAAANERYARSIGVATSELTVQQEQLAFAAEVQRQAEVLARSYGRTQVLETQRATEATNELRASWQNFFAALGERGRDITETIGGFGSAFLRGLQVRVTGVLPANAAFGQEVQQVSNLNRLEQQRNTILTERLGILSKAAQSGSIDVRQQRNLIQIQRDILAQQERIFGAGGIGPPSSRFSDLNVQRAETSRLEAAGIVSRLAENRSLGRIAALQAPAAAALTAIESFGFEVGRLPENLRLSAEQVRNLLENTNEARQAREGLAAIFGVSVDRITELIPLFIRLNEERKKEVLTLNQMIAAQRRAIESGDFLRAQYQRLADLLPVTLNLANIQRAAQIAQQGPQSLFRIPTGEDFSFEGAAGRAGIVEAFEGRFPGLDVQLTDTERFAEAAANMGVTLDFMQDSLSSFVEGIALEGQNLRQALTNFLQSIARTLIRSQFDQTSGGLLSAFTNAVTEPGIGAAGSTRYGSTYNTQVNVGIANPLQARAADASARIFGGAGG